MGASEPEGWLQRVVLLVGPVVVVAAVAMIPTALTALRDRNERNYCQSERRLIEDDHKQRAAEGQPPQPFYIEHFVETQDYMEQCLDIQRCERHGPLGLNHRPRRECTFR